MCPTRATGGVEIEVTRHVLLKLDFHVLTRGYFFVGIYIESVAVGDGMPILPPGLGTPILQHCTPVLQIVAADTPIFLRLIADLFPNMDLAPKVGWNSCFFFRSTQGKKAGEGATRMSPRIESLEGGFSDLLVVVVSSVSAWAVQVD